MFLIYSLSSLKIVWTLLLAVLCFKFPATERIIIIALVVLVVVSDIIDGRIASLVKRNNSNRRLFDNFSDVIITHIAYIAIIYFLGWSLLWYMPLFIRDSILVLMGLKTTINKIVIFPGIFHKFARLVLPISAIFMLCDYYGEIALITALILFFVALADYYGYFMVMCHKIKNHSLDTTKNEGGLNEVHLNSSLMGLNVLVLKQKLLPPANKSE